VPTHTAFTAGLAESISQRKKKILDTLPAAQKPPPPRPYQTAHLFSAIIIATIPAWFQKRQWRCQKRLLPLAIMPWPQLTQLRFVNHISIGDIWLDGFSSIFMFGPKEN
jgi:hypothetical protein